MRVKRSLAALALALFPCAAGAQSNDWKTVEQIPKNELVRVSDFSHSETCYFLAADETYLTCERRRQVLFFVTLHERSAFRKGEVLAVRESRQVLSTLAGGAIGAGAGAAIGAGIDASAKNTVEEGHLVTLLLALLGLGAGSAIGSHTDFLAGPVIYRKP